MVDKTYPNKTPITEADLEKHLGSAHEIMSRSKVQAATAIGHLWQIYANAQSGDAKKWFKQRVEDYNNLADSENLKIDARFQEADLFMKGGLASDHDAVKKTTSQQEKDLQEALQKTFRSDAAISKAERRKLKYVSQKDRENNNEFTAFVRIGFHLYYPDQAVLVSRNCCAMEFVKGKFPDKSIPTIEEIVAVFEAAGGFDAAIEHQRNVKQDNSAEAEIRAIGKAAIRAAAREKVRAMPSIAQIKMPISRTKDGFANVLVRVNGEFVEVISEADAPEVEIESTVNRIGSALQVDADPNCELAGRLLEYSRLVPSGHVIMSDDGKTKLGKSQQFITMRPGSDSTPELVVSTSRVEAGPVLIARPHDQALMGLRDEYAVIRSDDRKTFEMAFNDPGQRSIRSISVDLQPKTADGRPAKAHMSWVVENIAVKDANAKRIKEDLKPLTEIEQIYWDDFNNVTHKPLDIDGFSPQLTGSLTAADMADILSLVTKSSDQTKAAIHGDDKAKTGRIQRTLEFIFAEEKLAVVYGDAEALELDCSTGSKSTVTVKLRMLDVMGLLTCLNSHDCQKVELQPDDRGLVRFSWQDSYASYAIHFPTCAADAKLSTKRLATMRVELPAMVQAAE